MKAFAQLGLDSAWLDGEAVVLDENGVRVSRRCKNAFDSNRPQDIVVYLFDVPFLNGLRLARRAAATAPRDFARAAGARRRQRAARFSNDFEFSADDLLKSACDMALEGIIGKRRDSG